MRPEEADAVIERLLAKQTEYIPDDGFTARVVGNLPAPGLSRAVRMGVLAGFALCGAALVTFATPASATVFQAMTVLGESLATLSVPPLWAVATLGVVALGAFGVTRMEQG